MTNWQKEIEQQTRLDAYQAKLDTALFIVCFLCAIGAGILMFTGRV